jgi:hypothetical protein
MAWRHISVPTYRAHLPLCNGLYVCQLARNDDPAQPLSVNVAEVEQDIQAYVTQFIFQPTTEGNAFVFKLLSLQNF